MHAFTIESIRRTFAFSLFTLSFFVVVFLIALIIHLNSNISRCIFIFLFIYYIRKFVFPPRIWMGRISFSWNLSVVDARTFGMNKINTIFFFIFFVTFLVSLCILFVWYELNIFLWNFRLIWILCGATFTPDQRFYIFVISKPFEFWDTFFFAIVCLNFYAFLSTRKMFSMLVQLIACDALAALFIRRIYTWFE